MAEESRARNFRQRLVTILTKTSHASAPFITTFLLIHLSAPVMANAGGSSLSSRVMLLGREYYQTAIGEPYLVLAPLAVHALSGIVRRALIVYPRLNNFVFPITTLSVTAYSVLLLLPIHFGIHRILPTTPSSPVLSLGPSELDHSFVQFGLQHWPIRTWAMYTALVGATIAHAVEGARVLMGSSNPTISTSNLQSTEKSSQDSLESTNARLHRKLLAVALTVPVLSGLYFLYAEPLYIFPDIARRLEGVYQLSWIYRTR
ncbi:hypothetical protein GYMLUDRAFT_169967 [Collybiopsis luxurians FD-317 M1]|uniref:Mitochondrial adapter protein MCP1 transmembrane domain-containing protein n=1 Tax=Collybiopsis luxurians FD-317 M1 TaxID=944289 RepID=A0A0D0CTJ5_9AGAR|nr:hypothetical protein GYMLUDRAFT_169967 [Collybiopsis luxurians FD-317 M1]